MISDRPGNNRLDTLSSIIANPEVAPVFFIRGVEVTAGERAGEDRRRRAETR